MVMDSHQLLSGAAQPHPLRLRASLALVSVLSVACATGSEVDTLRDLPPAPLVVLVEWGGRNDVPTTIAYGGAKAQASPAEMAELLAQELRALNASSRVCTRSELAGARPDLTLQIEPRGDIEAAHVGTTNFLASGGLWLVTWVGGLLVEDSTYSVGVAADCRYARSSEEYFERPITAGEVDLSFFDRNDLLSLPGLQSLILPPFWTSDQSAKTCETLKRSAMRIAAREIARKLKVEFVDLAQTEFRCSVQLLSPSNGAPVVATTMPIKLKIMATGSEPVGSVTAVVNGGNPIALQLRNAEGLTVEASGELAGLEPNRDNWVELRVVADDLYTRTLRLGSKQ